MTIFDRAGVSTASGLGPAAMSRRLFLIGAGSAAITGCASSERTDALLMQQQVQAAPPVVPLMYQAIPYEQFPIPAVDIRQLDQRYWRTDVDFPSDERPGTVIVDTPTKYLYHVKPGGRATRYGIGVGRDGYSWSGRARIAYKREWPRWTPPNEMVARQPELEPYSIANGGMPPSLTNPLGARALYIHEGNRDTIYRIHGSQEAWTIGKAVSSGCIRLLNHDIIHLHSEVRDGSPIVVIPDYQTGSIVVG